MSLQSSYSVEEEVSPLLSNQGDDLDGYVVNKDKEMKGPNASTASLKTLIRNDSFVRRPVQYHSINSPSSSGSGSGVQYDEKTQAAINRYKYYSRLDPKSDSSLLMPDHVVPQEFFFIITPKAKGEQSSLITIFSLWNTMMGTSLLSMPWAISQAGFANGIVLMVVMAGLALYTAYRVMKSVDTFASKGGVALDFSDVCRQYLGRWGEYGSVFFSLSALLGAMIVYWVLMSNFIYNTVTFIYAQVTHDNSSIPMIKNTIACPNPVYASLDVVSSPIHNGTTQLYITNQNGYMGSYRTTETLVLPFEHILNTGGNTTTPGDTFSKLWDQTKTVPLFLIAILFPLLNFKSPTFFTKFNALGTISVAYILSFVVIKAIFWGIHLDFNPDHTNMYVPAFSKYFPNLTGTSSLAYFIHNCVITIVRNQKHSENNARDLTVAYICVAVTYLFVGIIFYSAFPLPKGCVADNLLDNFEHNDILAFVARIFLFFQMSTVLPMIFYIFRIQFLHIVFGSIYPSLKHVLLLNALLVSICLLFAIFLPQIGTIIRFSGAFCGLTYIFTLPCLVYLLQLREEGKLTWSILTLHGCIMAIGVANFAGQFITLS